MNKIKLALSFVAILAIFQSCYVSKSLDRDVKVKLSEALIVKINNSGNSNFSGKYTEGEYKAAFFEGMKAEFAGSHIILVENDPEFSIIVDELVINESTKSETVSDADSPDNGKVFELSELDLSSSGNVNSPSGTHVSSWSADKNKEEKVTNSRSGGQIITGDNKDNNTYREKEFSDDEALDLAQKCGRRSGARIINDIVRAIK